MSCSCMELTEWFQKKNSPWVLFIDFVNKLLIVYTSYLGVISWLNIGFHIKIVISWIIYTQININAVRYQGQYSNWYHARSPVRRGCIMSPLLFLVTMGNEKRQWFGKYGCCLVSHNTTKRQSSRTTLHFWHNQHRISKLSCFAIRLVDEWII